MAQSKNSFLSALASSVTSSGTVPTAALAPEVTTSIEGAGTAVYDSASLLPISGNTAGDTAFVKSTSRLYIHSGLGWYNVAVINNTPTVQSITDSDGGTTPFALAIDGTPTTITITAQDSDGDPLTYNYSADSGFAGLATLSQDANVFTITPFSRDSATTESGTITFSVTDGINTATPGAQTFTLNFLSPYWDETVLSIGTSSTNSLANSTFIDRSTNAHTVTATGSPVQTAFHPYLDNWSVYGGTNGVLTVPTSADFNMGNGDFTVDCWLNTTRDTGTIFDHGGNYLVTYNGMRWGWNPTTGYLKFTMNQQSNSASGEYSITGVTKVNDGQWHHLRVCRNGTTFRMFVDGVLDISGTSSVTGYQPSSAMVLLGALSNNNPNPGFANSYLLDLHMIKGTSLSTTNDSFDIPTTYSENVAGTVLHTFTSNRFVDISTYDRDITPYNTAQISAYNPFGQGSEYAPGENKGSVFSSDGGDYLAVPQIDLGTGDFTIECWHYSRSRINTRNGIWGNYSSYSAGALGLFAGHQSGTSTAYQVAYNGGSFPGAGLQGGTIVYNQWNHIAVVRNSGTMDLYINGTSVASKSLTADLGGVGSNFYINTPGDNLTYGIDGYIADFSVDVGTAKYTSDFTPPTSQVGSSGKDLYLPMDNAGIYDKTGNYPLTLNGDTATSTTQTKFADTAIYFDGTGDCISLSANPTDFLPGTGAATIEVWVKTSSSGAMSIFSNFLSSSPFNGIEVGLNNGYQTYWSEGTWINYPSASTGTSGINDGGWHHLAWVITNNGTTVTTYIDGVQNYTSSITASTTGNASQTIGADSNSSQGRYFNGYIENLQILKGVAKYTSNFTPPTQTQGRTYQAES